MAVLELSRVDVAGQPRVAPPRRIQPWWLAPLWHAALVALPAAALGVLAWRHRWIADDGLIVVRTARQIAAGNGPVINVGERVEASTSVLWAWMLSVPGLTGHSIAKSAVYGGLVLSVLGFALALDGTRRLYRRGSSRWLVPGGAMIVLALPPFWDFSTSGLETGLTFGWLGLCWWLLVGLSGGSPTWWRYLAGFVFGLGPLVRPDLGVVTVVFGVAGYLIVRPARRQVAALICTAFALPGAYQIFRMGYYGVLVPNTAIAKEAQLSNWKTGWNYVENFVSTYHLWLPVVLLALLVNVAWWRRPDSGWARTGVVAPAAAAIAGAVLAVYIAKVGGDFMHGRMLLPATFCLLLPVMLIPLRRHVLVAVLAIAVWAGFAALYLRVPDGLVADGFNDERRHWLRLTSPHPVTEGAYHGLAHWTPHLDAAVKHRQLAYPGNGVFEYGLAPVRYHRPTEGVLFVRILGTPATALPVDGVVVDQLGLSYPLAAHMTLTRRGMPGHEKSLPAEWMYADYTPDGFVPPGFGERERTGLAAARRALRCAGIAELQRSVRDPLTADRFVKNLFGSVDRTFFRFPGDPVEAERSICKGA